MEFSPFAESNEFCEFSSIISDLRMGGDDWSAKPHDISPVNDVRRMLSGSVVDGGGMIPASILFDVSFKWLAHNINVLHVDGAFFSTGVDGVGDIERDESSFPYPKSAAEKHY